MVKGFFWTSAKVIECINPVRVQILKERQLCCFPTAALLGLTRVGEFSCHYKSLTYNWKFFSFWGRLRSHEPMELAIPERGCRQSACPCPFPKILGLLASEIQLWVLCCSLSATGLVVRRFEFRSVCSLFFFVSALQGSAIEQFRMHAWVKRFKVVLSSAPEVTHVISEVLLEYREEY